MPTFSLGPNFFQSTIFYSSKPTRARSGPLIPWVRSLFTISNWMVLNWLDDIRYWSTPYPKWSHLICVERSPHWHPGVFWLHRSSCCLPFYANESSAWCVFFLQDLCVCHPPSSSWDDAPLLNDGLQGPASGPQEKTCLLMCFFNSQRLKTMWLVIDWKPPGCLLEIIIWYDFSLVFSKL